eukprot:scaffold3068_cov401-Prasinococcus_capsulatus_cf.AAC.29
MHRGAFSAQLGPFGPTNSGLSKHGGIGGKTGDFGSGDFKMSTSSSPICSARISSPSARVQ